ncbi:MAG: NAD(P)/FAD-dependent oxidoreductase [Haloarculaceae archaeon]
MIDDPSTVLVVGGGVVGCATARALAPDHDVTVLEEGSIASGATGKASGLVSPVYDHQVNLAAARYATQSFREFDGTGHFSFHEHDGVFLVGDDEIDHAREAAATAEAAGFSVDVLDPDALDDRYPDTFDVSRFASAVVFEDSGWVDPHTFATTLADAAKERGVRVETGVRVEGIRADERVRGVDTTEGTFEADAVVVAAGWRTRDLVSDYLEIPTRPFRYQTMVLETGRDLREGFPISWEHDARIYWRPTRDGNLHVGGQPYFVSSPGTVREGATESFRTDVATRLPEYLPHLGATQVVTHDTCPTGDTATPDGLPVIDSPDEAPAGLVVSTGMHGFGIMLGPAVGAATRAHVTAEDPPFPLDPYALDRFDDRGTDFGSAYIREP